MRKKLGFTLVEVLVAVTLTGAILVTGYSAFQRIMQAQASLGATIDVQKNLFYTNEKLAALIRDGGTVDYEEYFNRRMLGYTRDFVATLTPATYTFTNFSHFGNGNDPIKKQSIYYCGMVDITLTPDQSTWVDAESCMGTGTDVLMTPADALSATDNFSTIGNTPHQPYGQYAALSYNYLDPAGYPVPIKLPPIFETTGGEKIKIFDRGGTDALTDDKLIEQDPQIVGLPELYLIKKNLDNTYTRTYFRHVYVQDGFLGATPCDPTTSLEGCLGKIQMTKLSGCDTVGAPDGIIDAWIPLSEFAIGIANCPTDADKIYFAAHEDTINPGSHSPNLTWVDLTAPDMNVIRATFLPTPLKIPTLMSGTGDIAQSPKVTVYLEVQLSTKLRSKSFVRENVNYPRLLITTYDLSE